MVLSALYSMAQRQNIFASMILRGVSPAIANRQLKVLTGAGLAPRIANPLAKSISYEKRTSAEMFESAFGGRVRASSAMRTNIKSKAGFRYLTNVSVRVWDGYNDKWVNQELTVGHYRVGSHAEMMETIEETIQNYVYLGRERYDHDFIEYDEDSVKVNSFLRVKPV